MFRSLAAQAAGGAAGLVKAHPIELIGSLERAWNTRMQPVVSNNPPPLGHPDNRSHVPGLATPVLPSATPGFGVAGPFSPSSGAAPVFSVPRWDHLIYAYMVENTRLYEIFRRVVFEFLHGEKLGTPAADTLLWLRNTEELFYRDPPSFSITTLTSHLRKDLGAVRRNIYHRMFGMDLNHGADDNSPYPYVKANAANNEFVTTFEELLREVWLGHINHTNRIGARPTDDSKIEELARKLHDMLRTRRQSGNLSREEFFAVAMMSWFHLTVENANLPIMQDLRADGSSPEQRLFKIAQLVGLPAHGLSRSYFQLGDDLSAVLIEIETGALHEPGAAPAFYTPTPINKLADRMTSIITHWSLITGRDIKAGKVAPS